MSDKDFLLAPLEELVLTEPIILQSPRFLTESGEPLRTDLYKDTRDITPEKYAYIDYESEGNKMTWYIENPGSPLYPKNPQTSRRLLTPEEFGLKPDERGDYRFPFIPLSNPEIEARILRKQADFISEKNRHLIAIGYSALG
jgi:hypothetical protein